jgi:hypothetical protein
MKNSSPNRNPRTCPDRPAADHVIGGVDVVAAVLVPHDHRDRIRLDDKIGAQAARHIGGLVRGR